MDWQALLHNKWMLGGAAVAATAGVVVLVRKKQAGGANSSTAPPAAGGGVGGFDSTGTDVAHWVGSEMDRYQGQLSQQLADQNAAVQDQLADVIAQAQDILNGMHNEAPAAPAKVPAPGVPPRVPVVARGGGGGAIKKLPGAKPTAPVRKTQAKAAAPYRSSPSNITPGSHAVYKNVPGLL
jgi:hypothetical protein